MYIVPMDGAAVRFLGGNARARNARVASRAGASVVSVDHLACLGLGPAVLVPAGSALMLPLFSNAVFLEAVHGSVPTRLDTPDGASLFVGLSSSLAGLAHDTTRLSQLPARPIDAACVLNIATRSARRRSTTIALRATAKATDGFVSRTFNRPLSRACSRAALALGMSATTASLFTLLVGLSCAWIAAQPGAGALAITGLLFHLASVLDGVDGEIARSTLTESEAGARVDTVVDQLTYLACFAGMTIGWVREGSGTTALWSTAVIGLALIASLVRAGRFVARHAPDASFVWIDRAVRRAAADTGLMPLRAAAGLFTLLRRDLFAVVFLAVSLSGQRAAVPALIGAGVLVANLTLTAYRYELADAARALRGEVPNRELLIADC